MGFNKEKIRSIREELNSILYQYCKKENLDFKIGPITFESNSFRCKLEMYNTSNGESGEKIAFEKDCYKFNIPKNWYGKVIMINSKAYLIVGINTRARKYPIILKSIETGIDNRKISVDGVRSLIEKNNI